MKPTFLLPLLCFIVACGTSQQAAMVNSQRTVGMLGSAVTSLCVTGGNTVIGVAEDSGLVRSTDGGAHWSSYATGVATRYVSAIVVNSHGDLFASTIGSGIYRRLRDAETWTRVDTSAPKDALLRVHALAVSLVDNAVYASTLEHGVYRSTDNGLIWRNYNVGLGIMNINAITVNDANVIFARCVGGGVFRHAPIWDEWQPINAGLDDPYITTVASRRNGGILLGTRNGHVYLFDTYHDVWKDVSKNLPGYYVTVVGALAGGTILAATKSGLYQFSTSDSTWSEPDHSLDSVNIRSMAIQTDGTVFLGASDGQVMKIVVRE